MSSVTSPTEPWFLREAVGGDPVLSELVHGRLVELLPAVAAALTPPRDGAFDALGVDSAELAAFGLDALNRRLKLIGVSLGDSAE